MFELGNAVKFSPEFRPRENDRVGVIDNVDSKGLSTMIGVRWATTDTVQSYHGFYEPWHLQEVSK